jgi:hypothetical protein
MRLVPGLLALSLIALSACADWPGKVPPGAGAPPPVRADHPGPRTPESFEIEAFYTRVEAGLVARGLLRSDGGGPDVPFDARRLADTFMALALTEEFSLVSGRLVKRDTPSVLHRWIAPVRIETVTGPSVEPTRASADRAAIASFADRLARSTGHPIRATDARGNLKVLILNDQELRRAGALIRTHMPEVTEAETSYVENMPRETYCVVIASDPADDGVYTRAVAVIRAELPDRLRTSCIHEEIAQGLGLNNDSRSARPSIFNDDDEFGRLTTMDEHLLGLLYDPRLKPGQTAAETAPLIRTLAAARLAPAT